MNTTTQSAEPAEKRPVLMAVTRWALVVLGLTGAGLRAFPIAPRKDDAYPVIDLTTLAFLALLLIAFYLPRIKGITIGKATIALTDAVDELADATDNTADLAQNWMYALGYVIRQMRATGDQSRVEQLFWNFVRDRLGEMKQELSSSPDDRIRVALWLVDAETDELAFAFSNEIVDDETMNKRFASLEGLIGQAFDEQRFWNEGEATVLPSFVPVRSRGETGYVVVAAAPVSLFQERLGMLTFDKATEGRFDERSSNIALAGARMIGIAYAEFVGRLADIGAWTREETIAGGRR